MKHKTELRKGLVAVKVAGQAPVGAEIMAYGRPAGRLCTRSDDRALAWLRLDRAGGTMTAGEARLWLAGG